VNEITSSKEGHQVDQNNHGKGSVAEEAFKGALNPHFLNFTKNRETFCL